MNEFETQRSRNSFRFVSKEVMVPSAQRRFESRYMYMFWPGSSDYGEQGVIEHHLDPRPTKLDSDSIPAPRPKLEFLVAEGQRGDVIVTIPALTIKRR